MLVSWHILLLLRSWQLVALLAAVVATSSCAADWHSCELECCGSYRSLPSAIFAGSWLLIFLLVADFFGIYRFALLRGNNDS